MTKTICLNENSSTTRILTKEKPIIQNKPENKFATVLFSPKSEERKGEGGLRTQGYFKKSYEDKPLITVITVVYNGEKDLEQTIQSVIHQTYDNVEYIIIDGGSTDGTLDIIKKYAEQIDYWVSEPDKGIYDAMNKGIGLSYGVWINFMNIGDYFYNKEVLLEIFKKSTKYLDIDFIYSDTIFDNQALFSCDIETNTIIHQSLIYRRELHKDKGLYLVSEKLLISDYLFFMLTKDKNWYKSDVIISNYNTYGLSSQYYSLHFKQKVGVDLLFNNLSRKRAGILLLFFPFYYNLKQVVKKVLNVVGFRYKYFEKIGENEKRYRL